MECVHAKASLSGSSRGGYFETWGLSACAREGFAAMAGGGAGLLSSVAQAPVRLVMWLVGCKVTPLVMEASDEFDTLAAELRQKELEVRAKLRERGLFYVALHMVLGVLTLPLHVAAFLFWLGAAVGANVGMYTLLFAPRPGNYTLMPRIAMRIAMRLARRRCAPEMSATRQGAPLVDGGVYRLFDRCADKTDHSGTMMAFVPQCAERGAGNADADAMAGIPAVVLIAGGSGILCETVECIDTARWLRDRGVASFVVFYRTTLHGHNFHVMVADCVRAVQLCRHNARSWRLRSISAMGFSMGAHMVTMLASRRWEPSAALVACHDAVSRVSARPDTLLLMQGPTHGKVAAKVMADKRELEARLDAAGLGRHDWPQQPDEPNDYDALQQIDKDWPPVLLAHARGDKEVPFAQSADLAEALRAHGVEAELVELLDDGTMLDPKQHGFALTLCVGRKQPVTLMYFALVLFFVLQEVMEHLPAEAAVGVGYQVLWRCNRALLKAEMRAEVLNRVLERIVKAPPMEC